MNKNLLLQKHVLNIFVLLPHRQPKSQQKFSQQSSLTPFTHSLTLSSLKFALFQAKSLRSKFASALLVTLVETELSLEP